MVKKQTHNNKSLTITFVLHKESSLLIHRVNTEETKFDGSCNDNLQLYASQTDWFSMHVFKGKAEVGL